MLALNKLNLFSILLFLLTIGRGSAQTGYTFTKDFKNEDCTKGSAGVLIDGLTTSDTITITWNNGVTDVTSISELKAGNYWVNISIKNKIDTVINYSIEKINCVVKFSNHFTPNGDNYNDFWQISNTIYFPNFELFVFNKWGQQVHKQSGTYTPWDGKWNNINVADGTYYYVFYYEGSGKNKLEKGDVTILR